MNGVPQRSITAIRVPIPSSSGGGVLSNPSIVTSEQRCSVSLRAPQGYHLEASSIYRVCKVYNVSPSTRRTEIPTDCLKLIRASTRSTFRNTHRTKSFDSNCCLPLTKAEKDLGSRNADQFQLVKGRMINVYRQHRRIAFSSPPNDHNLALYQFVQSIRFNHITSTCLRSQYCHSASLSLQSILLNNNCSLLLTHNNTLFAFYIYATST